MYALLQSTVCLKQRFFFYGIGFAWLSSACIAIFRATGQLAAFAASWRKSHFTGTRKCGYKVRCMRSVLAFPTV